MIGNAPWTAQRFRSCSFSFDVFVLRLLTNAELIWFLWTRAMTRTSNRAGGEIKNVVSFFSF